MRFNFDILICLMRLTQERRDVSATMRTCRALYSAGMPSLLSFDIDFDVWERFAAFCSFMDVDAPRRSRFLRQMTLYMHHLSNSFSTGTLDHILCILQHATQLHQLRITTYVRGGPRPLDPRLIGALSSLTSIKHLTLGETSNDTVMILQSLHSPVAEARVDFKSGSDVDPILVLRTFSSSLQQLAALGSPVFPRAPHYDIQYSLVTKLEISVRIGSPIPLKPLIYSFPNLRVLRLVDEVDLDQVQPFEGDIALAGEGWRQANILSYSQRHWEALDHVSSDILNLYLLGLSCKVHHLHLEFARCYGVDNLRLIKETLSMIRPTRLHIRVFDDVDFNPTQLDRTVDDLTHLHINFIICSSELVDTPQVVVSFRRTGIGSTIIDIGNMTRMVS